MTAGQCSRGAGGGAARSAIKRIARVLPSAMLGAALALTAVVPAAKAAPADVEPTPWAAGDKTVVVDEPTITTWEGVAKDDTANVGRIWTDKTVFDKDAELPGGIKPVIQKGNSDFLVGLSALSSTSNTITTTSRPLDIVLVLDVSGSMRNELAAYKYSPVYAGDLDTRSTYYGKDESGSYFEINWHKPWFSSGYWRTEAGEKKAPKVSASDQDTTRIQFYSRKKVSSVSRMSALKTAANSFIEATAEQNDKIADEAKRHRISIVKFASDLSDKIGNDLNDGFWGDGSNFSQIVTKLTAYDSTSVNNGKARINALQPVGATRADYGMEKAIESLSSAREGPSRS